MTNEAIRDMLKCFLMIHQPDSHDAVSKVIDNLYMVKDTSETAVTLGRTR